MPNSPPVSELRKSPFNGIELTRATGLARETVRKYLAVAISLGLSATGPRWSCWCWPARSTRRHRLSTTEPAPPPPAAPWAEEPARTR